MTKINKSNWEKMNGKINEKEANKMAKKKQIGYDCSCCDFARELPNKDLENDFVYCCNPDCEFYYHVLFEHFKCKKDEEDKEEKEEEEKIGENGK